MNRLIVTPLFLLSALFVGCQPSSTTTVTDGGSSTGNQQSDDLTTDWQVYAVQALQIDGLLTPKIESLLDGNTLNIFYYDVHQSTGSEDTSRYDLRYLQWDLSTNTVSQDPETIVSLDNSRTIAAALDYYPQVAYQGGEIRECQGSEQSDAMLAMGSLSGWQEQTASIGFVDRTAPILEDGFAGGAMSLAIDSSGNRHLAYQFYYEGCDQNPFAYPDLHYVSLLEGVDYSDRDDAPTEEQVDGNVLDTDDSANYNKLVGTGDVNKLLIDTDGNPVVLYSAEDPDLVNGKIGLKVATRNAGDWTSLWLVDDCVVEGLDAAYDNSNKLAAAFYTTSCGETDDSDPQLHFIKQTDTGWDQTTISVSQQIGQFPALGFDANNKAIIAFYEKATYQNQALKNLKVVRESDQGWQISTVSNLEDVGQYNQIHILDSNEAVIISYLASANKIVLFRKSL